MNKHKLTIITQYFPPEMGAPQSRLWETAIGLKKRGWQIQVITAMPNYPTGKVFPDYRNKFSLSETIDDIKILRYYLYASNSKKTFPRIVSMLTFSFTVLFSCLKIRQFKPDYILTESPPLTLALSGLFLSKIAKSKHIINVSDLWPLSAYELGAISKGTIYNMLEWLEKFLYRNSFACTGQSNEIITQLIERGSKKTHLYRNGVDYKRFSTADAKYTQKNTKKTIVYAGLLGVAQGILAICKNIRFKETNCEFHIYGDGAEKIEIETFIRDNPEIPIFYHGKANRNDIPYLLKSYDTTIIPLIKPIFGAIPSKIYEAMAAELPIIFSGGGEGAKLIVEHEVGWICEPSDFESINQVLHTINTMDAIAWNKYKTNCKLAAQHVFDREIQINQLDLFLKES